MTQQTLPADEGTGPVVEPDALAAEAGAKGDTAIAVAPQWKLVWWGFKRHKLAMAGLVVTVVIYLLAIFAEFLAPYSSGHYNPTTPTHHRSGCTSSTTASGACTSTATSRSRTPPRSR